MTAGLGWRHARGVLDCSRGRLVGIVNANPDSFSDGGAHSGTEAAVAHGRRLAALGADVVEVGGESLRFAPPSPPEVEIGRVAPVIERLAAELDVPVAVDTYKPPVAAAAIAAGAAILNDPTGLRDPEMAAVAAGTGVGVVAAHFFGPPKVRPASFPDVDVPAVVAGWARERVAWAADARHRPRAPGHRPGHRPGHVAAPGPRADAAPGRGRRGRPAGAGADLQQEGARGHHRGRGARPPGRDDRGARAGAGRVARPCSGYTTWGSPARALEVAEALVTGRPERWHDVEK